MGEVRNYQDEILNFDSEEFLALREQLQVHNSNLLAHGIVPASPMVNSYRRFGKLEPKERAAIVESIALTNELYNAAGLNPDTSGSKSVSELAIFKAALKRFGLKPSDDKLYNFISDDHFFEFFDVNGHQVFRSYNFFTFCRFSILDLQTHDWAELWDRPAKILVDLLEITPSLYRRETGIYHWKIPTYAVREKHLSTNQTLLLDQKVACALICQATDKISAVVTTGQVRIVSSSRSGGQINIF